MGWLTMTRHHMGEHDTPKAYLDNQLTYEQAQSDGTIKSLRVLASSCVQNRVYYAAVEQALDGVPGPAFAVICLVRWNTRASDGHVFGYKDMDETMGPCETECPERILQLLGPSDNEHALDWRRRCLARLRRRARRPSLEDGMRIRLAEPMKFTDGHEGDEFVIEKIGRRLAFRSPAGRRYRISNFAERRWSVVHQTKVHSTLFA